MNLNTGFYQKGIINLNRIDIFKHNLGYYLIFEILAIIPMLLDPDTSEELYYFLNIMIFLKCITFVKFVRQLTEIVEVYYRFRGYLELFKLLITLMLIAHIQSILFYSIGFIEIQYFGIDNTWIHNDNIFQSGWHEQYIRSFYWAASSMVTVVVYYPKTIPETLFACFSFFLTCGVFGYSINQLGNIMAKMNEEKDQYQKDIQSINKCMNRRKISNSLKIQVRNYLEFRFYHFYLQKESEFMKSQEEENILKKLSKNLQHKIIEEERKQVLEYLGSFKQQFSIKTLDRLVYQMQEVYLGENELLYTEQQQDDKSLYLIMNGQIQILYINNKTNNKEFEQKISIKTKGSVFGFYSFFTGFARNETARSIGFCSLLKINRDQFINIIQQSNDDLESYCLIRDQIIFYNKFNVIEEYCYSCKRYTHQTHKCPWTHYSPNTFRVLGVLSKDIYAQNYNQYCLDNNYIKQRNQKFKQNCRININKIRFQMKNYRIDNKQIFDLTYDECIIDPISEDYDDYDDDEIDDHYQGIKFDFCLYQEKLVISEADSHEEIDNQIDLFQKRLKQYNRHKTQNQAEIELNSPFNVKNHKFIQDESHSPTLLFKKKKLKQQKSVKTFNSGRSIKKIGEHQETLDLSQNVEKSNLSIKKQLSTPSISNKEKEIIKKDSDTDNSCKKLKLIVNQTDNRNQNLHNSGIEDESILINKQSKLLKSRYQTFNFQEEQNDIRVIATKILEEIKLQQDQLMNNINTNIQNKNNQIIENLNNSQINQGQWSLILEFDKIHEFNIYFPQGNIANIIKQRPQIDQLQLYKQRINHDFKRKITSSIRYQQISSKRPSKYYCISSSTSKNQIIDNKSTMQKSTKQNKMQISPDKNLSKFKTDLINQ